MSMLIFLGLSGCEAVSQANSQVSVGPTGSAANAGSGNQMSNREGPDSPSPPAEADYEINPEEDQVRTVAFRFFSAAIEGNLVSLENMTEPGMSPARKAARSPELFTGLGVAIVVVRGDRALVVSTPLTVQNPSGQEQGALLLTFKNAQGVGWRCLDIDFEQTNDIPGELARFQQR
ncbi:MAG: hypothetical protein AAGH88_14395 [Planctomycetota bacterium]